MGGLVPGREVEEASPLFLGKRLTGIALGVLGWAAFAALTRSPELAEAVAGSGPIPAIRRGLSLVSGSVPFALAEIVVLVFVARQVVGLVRGVGPLLSGRAAFGRTAMAGALRLAQDTGVVLFLFYLLWGFQYARPDLESRLGIDAAGEVGADELHRLAERAVETANGLYREIHGSSDAGVPTSATSIAAEGEVLSASWDAVQQEFGFRPIVAASHGAPKAFLASPIVKEFGVAGMHFPFTGEALIVGDLPAVTRSLSLAHEMAHQRGFAREDEANVLGFLAARVSRDPISRYAAYVFLQRQLIDALRRVAPDDASELARARDPGVDRDLEDLRRYWEPAQGIARAAASRANDVMLRSHGIPEGVASYQGSVWVLVALARERGEEVLFPSSFAAGD